MRLRSRNLGGCGSRVILGCFPEVNRKVVTQGIVEQSQWVAALPPKSVVWPFLKSRVDNFCSWKIHMFRYMFGMVVRTGMNSKEMG